MTFTKRLRAPITRGEITCSIRIWKSPHVRVGGHYQLDRGFILVTSVRRITLADITPELAKRSGFSGVVDLLKVAKHGAGENAYLIDSNTIYRDRDSPVAALSLNSQHNS